MNQVDLMTPEKVAAQYGGDKRKIAQAASMGVIDPTVAVMAGMFIDRMRNAAASEQAPNTTVAQDVMAPPAPQPQMQGAPQAQPAMGLESAAAAPVERGLEAIPVPEEMYDEQSFAGGGIVAFTEGGETRNLREFYQRYGYFPDRSVYRDIFPRLSNVTSGLAEDIAANKGDPGFIAGRSISGGLATIPATVLDTNPALMASRIGSAIGGSEFMSDFKRGLLGDEPEQNKVAPKATPKAEKKATADKATADKATADKATADRIAAARAGVGSTVTTKTKAVAPTSSEEDYLAKLQGMYERAGALKDPDAAARAGLDEMRAASKASKEDALNMALINAGLGIAAGTSPYALQNVATGAQEGMKSYAQSQKEAKDEAREYLKIQAELDRAADARARGDVKTALELEESAATRAQQLRISMQQLAIQRDQARRPLEYELLREDMLSKDPARVRLAEARIGVGKMGTLTYEDAAQRWEKLDYGEKSDLRKLGITRDMWIQTELQKAGGQASSRGKVVNGVYYPPGS